MDHELLILGAGPGGYEAAIRAAQLGLNVGLIERDAVGGTCLNRGCIPTKTLLHDAGPGADFLALNAHKEQVVSTLRQGVEGLLKKRRVTVYRGTGMLTDDHTIEVDGQAVTGEKLLLAPGSRPALPPVEGIGLALTSDDLLHEPRPLESLLILGGGVIGVEMAAFYAATGTKVTIVEAQERLLPQMDREISQNLQMIFKRQGMGVHTRALARRISEGGEGVVMELDGGETLTASAVLAAVGRRPNTDGLCAPGVALDMERGFIRVNECFETSLPGVYAIGDAIGGMMLAHVASAQGLTVVHALAGEEAPLCLTAIPACVYVSPEIASVGLTQADCQQRGIEVKVGKALMGANGRTLIAGGQRGFIKVVVSAENGRVLGAQLMCERATDMIDSFTVAIANGLTATQLMRAVRPHPTFLEAVGEALDALEGRAIHS